MKTVIETAIALALVLGVLVLFHEFGHYITARLTGMRVEEFAFGFGKRIVTLFKRRDTEFTIHWLPLGGFCKIAGMEPGEDNIPDGFQAQAIWKRALVVFAGPFASFVLAAIIFVTIGALWGFPLGPNVMNRVAQVDPETVAQRIGLRAGDWIREINSKKITSGDEAVKIIHNSPGKTITLTIERNGATMKKRAAPAWMIGYLGMMWSFQKTHEGVAQTVPQDSPASKAGIKQDDALVSINGQKIESGYDLAKEATAAGLNEVKITVRRNHKPITLDAKPTIAWVNFMGEKWLFPGAVAAHNVNKFKSDDIMMSINSKKISSGGQMLAAISSAPAKFNVMVARGDNARHVPIPATTKTATSGTYDAVGLLGFLPQPVLTKKGVAESVKIGLEELWGLVGLLINALQPSHIAQNIGGPIMIVDQTYSMVALGIYYVAKMAGILSLSLAFINLVPIPVVDGGHLAILAIEAIRRKRLTAEQMQIATAIGMAILVVLFFAIFSHDILRIKQGLVPQ